MTIQRTKYQKTTNKHILIENQNHQTHLTQSINLTKYNKTTKAQKRKTTNRKQLIIQKTMVKQI